MTTTTLDPNRAARLAQQVAADAAQTSGCGCGPTCDCTAGECGCGNAHRQG